MEDNTARTTASTSNPTKLDSSKDGSNRSSTEHRNTTSSDHRSGGADQPLLSEGANNQNPSSPAIVTLTSVTTETSAATGANDPRVLLHTSNGTWLCCVPCYWLKHNNSVHKASLTVATLLVTSLLVASPVLFLISSVPGGEVIRDCFPQMQEKCTYNIDGSIHKICDNSACKTVAVQIFSSMDMTVSPCHNFYKYTCGSSLQIPDNRFTMYSMQTSVNLQLQKLLVTNATDGAFEKLGLFYHSCISVNDKPSTLNSLYSTLDTLGGYLPPSTLGPTDLTPLLIQLFEINGCPLIDIYLDYDAEDKLQNAVYINVPSYQQTFFKFVPSILTSDKQLEQRLQQAKLLLDGFLPKKMTEQQRLPEYQNILSFVSSLDKLRLQSKRIQWDTTTKFNITTLQQEYTFIQWDRLFQEVLSINITDIDVLYVVSPFYLTKLEDLITYFHKRVIHNAILMIYARDVLLNLVNTTQYHLPTFCVQVTANIFSEAMSALYLRQFPTFYIQHLTTKVTQLFNRLKRTLSNRMKILNWMDETTRKRAMDKLKGLREQYLTWPNLFNNTYIMESLRNVEIDPDNFFENVLNRFRELYLVNNKHRSDRLQMYPYVVDIQYKPRENIILIPLSLITQAYLRDDIPEYIPYASMGTILMHAILHAFDLYGINYDTNGTKTVWFTPESRLGFEARIDCFTRQYVKHFLKNKKTHNDYYMLDWNTTRNENMAYVGSLQTTYQTWRNYQQDMSNIRGTQSLYGMPLTPKQLFFVIAAQTNCIHPSTEIKISAMERVNGIMMNSPSFSEVFECQLGSPMNPIKKCSTW